MSPVMVRRWSIQCPLSQSGHSAGCVQAGQPPAFVPMMLESDGHLEPPVGNRGDCSRLTRVGVLAALSAAQRSAKRGSGHAVIGSLDAE